MQSQGDGNHETLHNVLFALSEVQRPNYQATYTATDGVLRIGCACVATSKRSPSDPDPGKIHPQDPYSANVCRLWVASVLLQLPAPDLCSMRTQRSLYLAFLLCTGNAHTSRRPVASMRSTIYCLCSASPVPSSPTPDTNKRNRLLSSNHGSAAWLVSSKLAVKKFV